MIELEIACRNRSLSNADQATATHCALHLLKEQVFKTKEGKTSRIQDCPTMLSKKKLIACKRELREKDLVVLRADKGGQIVILNNADYRKKGMEYIRSNNIQECTTFTEKPIGSVQQRLKAGIKNCPEFFPNAFSCRRVVLPNPQVRQLYGLPKAHKQGAPLRLIKPVTRSW